MAKTLNKIIHLSLWLVLGSSSLASGQESAKQLFDIDTIGYVRVDIQEIDSDATVHTFVELVGENSTSGKNLLMFKDGCRQILDSLKSAGVRQAYILLSLGDLPSAGPRIYLDQGDPDKVIAAVGPLLSMAGFQHRKLEDGLLVGPSSVLERVDSNPLPRRNDMDEVFRLHAGSSFSLVYAPSVYQRKALRESLPDLPAPLTRLTRSVLADGAANVAIRVAPLAERSLELEVVGSDEKQNQMLAAALEDLNERIVKKEIGLLDLFVVSGRLPVLRQEVNAVQAPGVFTSPPLVQEGNRFVVSFGRDSENYRNLCHYLSRVVRAFETSQNLTARVNRLQQLVLACHNYHDAHKTIPPVASRSADGRPLLSWRVLILPYLGENDLYEQFHLDEPWDSPHNKTLIDKMPGLMISDEAAALEYKTTFLIPTGPSVAGRLEPLRLRDFKDGTSRTILIADTAPESAVIWTRPDDWEYADDAPLRGLIADGEDLVRVGFADGSIHWLPADPEIIRAKLSVAGGEILD